MIKILEKQFISYVSDLLEKGYSEEGIEEHLESQYGYDSESVREAIQEAKGNSSALNTPSQTRSLNHSTVIAFVGVILLVGVVLNGLFFMGDSGTDPGSSVREPIGVATQPVTEQNNLPTQEAPAQRNEPAIEQTAAAVQTQNAQHLESAPSNSNRCYNGFYTFRGLYQEFYANDGEGFLAQLIPPEADLTGFFGESQQRLGRGVFSFDGSRFDVNLWFSETEEKNKEQWTHVETLDSPQSNVEVGIRRNEMGFNEGFIRVKDKSNAVDYVVAYASFTGGSSSVQDFFPYGLESLRCKA